MIVILFPWNVMYTTAIKTGKRTLTEAKININ